MQHIISIRKVIKKTQDSALPRASDTDKNLIYKDTPRAFKAKNRKISIIKQRNPIVRI